MSLEVKKQRSEEVSGWKKKKKRKRNLSIKIDLRENR